MNSLVDRLLGFAVSLLVAAFVLQWALRIVAPLTPWLVITLLAAALARWVWLRRSAW